MNSSTPHRCVRYERITLGVLGVLLTISALRIHHHSQSFVVEAARFSETQVKDWYDAKDGFRPINLPFTNGHGFFQIDFKSSKESMRLAVYGQDCVEKVYLDGEPVYKRKIPCRPCTTFASSSFSRCYPKRVELELKPERLHTIAVQTGIAETPAQTGRIFFAEPARMTYGWRLGFGLLLGLFVTMLIWIRRRGAGAAWSQFEKIGHLLREHRAFAALVVGAVAVRIIVSPASQTADIFDSIVFYVEDFFHKNGWNYTQLSSDYMAGIHGASGHMTHAPGAYYQFLLPRWLFGFNRFYFTYVTGMPALLGDLMIAAVVYRVVMRAYSVDVAKAVALIYLLCGGFFVTSALMNQPDSLAIGLLSLALLNRDRFRFSVYLGLAITLNVWSLFVMPWFIFQRRYLTRSLLAISIATVFAFPFLIDDPSMFFERLFLGGLSNEMSGFTWMFSLKALGVGDPLLIAALFTACAPLLVLLIPIFIRSDVWVFAAISFSVAVLMAKNVHDYTLMWPALPLVIVYAKYRRLLSLGAAAFCALSMLVIDMRGPEFVGATAENFAILLTVILIVAVLDLVIWTWSPRLPWGRRAHDSSKLDRSTVSLEP